MRLHVQRHGHGKALVCLHGFLGSGDNLWPVADYLKAERESLLTDLRGHGRSPHGRPYTLEALADDVAETLQAERVEQADVLGHSLGGKVALTLALRHPERIRRLVVADITMAQVPPRYGPLLEAMAATPLAGLRRREEAEPWLRDAEPHLETRRFLLKNLIPAEDGGFRWRFDLQGLREDHAKILAQVPAGPPFPGPTLLIRGDRSELCPDAGVELTRRYFPALELLTLPGGHWIHVDAREAFHKAVAAFLGR
jgi:esterase